MNLTMMQQVPSLPSRLKNDYYALRHGESIPNVIGIIVSDPERGVQDRYGLSEKGKSQAQKTAQSFHHDVVIDPDQESSKLSAEDLFDRMVIYSSDFSRAKQTANIFKQTLSLLLRADLESQQKELGDMEIPLFETDRLRERYFGKYWEGKSNQHYNEIWENDISDASSSDEHFSDVELTEAVLKRAMSVISEAEQKYQNKIVIVVAHGDVLQILQTAFMGVHPRKHRALPHINTAELRHMSNTSRTGQ